MKRLYTTIISLAIFSLNVCLSEAGSFTSKELICDAKKIDGNIVTYKGEGVAAIMKRGDYSWINLNDGSNAIGIWSRTGLLSNVRVLGDYKNKGDILEVTGAFHRACAEHGGELDIHADGVRIAARGFPIRERVSLPRIKIAMVFFVMTLLAVFVFRKKL